MLGVTTFYPLALVVVFFAGVGAVSSAAQANTLIQINVPGNLRGRVMSVLTTVSVGSSPIGNGLTGTAGGVRGTPFVVLLEGAVVLATEVVASVAVLRGRIRFVDSRVVDVAPVLETSAAATARLQFEVMEAAEVEEAVESR